MHERSIFMEALELDDPREREAHLALACGDDELLRARVEALLRRHEEAGECLLDRAPRVDLMDTAVLTALPEDQLGRAIGPYRLMEQLGEGGMGVVYVAEQHEPVRRRVALKVIKPGMDTKQVIARFEAERQALALMDHPNIARVHDAGTTPAGRPFFVMELVRGIPITDFCDRERLPIRDRLDLFVLVCRAVQHAHQKGIIHRDLKPSNILVTVIDGVAVPKVIDFGIAKATGAALYDGTVYTGFHQLVGTPLYMSPEQADLSGVDVDTRSDVYSLGVLLYELLTGTTPFDAETLRGAAFDEMRRIIREEEPPRPSLRLSTLEADRRSGVSATRRADPGHLRRSLLGELDWIAMKALEKDRRRRYETANALAADVLRHLADEPVEACPPSARYRFSKFARRNRAALVTGLLVALALAAGAGVSVWQAVEATNARRLAEARSAQARRAVDDMYTEVAEKWLAQQPDLSPVQQEFLEKALAFYEAFAEERADDPKVQLQAVEARSRVVAIHSQLGRLDRAEVALQQVLWQLEELADRHPDEIQIRQTLVQKLTTAAGIRLIRGRPDEAEPIMTRAVRIADDLYRQIPEDQPARCVLALALKQKAQMLDSLDRLGEAEVVARRSRDLYEQHQAAGNTKPDCLAGYANSEMLLGIILTRLKKLPEAEAAQARSLRLREGLMAENPGDPNRSYELCTTLINLATTQLIAGRVEESVHTYRRVVQKLEALVARHPDRPDYAHQLTVCLVNLFTGLRLVGSAREAEEVGRRGVELAERLAKDHPGVLIYRERLAWFLVRLADLHSIPPGPEFDEPATALDFARRAVELMPKDETALQSLGWAQYRAGDWGGCIETLNRKREKEGSDLFLAMAYWQQGNQERARACLASGSAWLKSYEEHWNPGDSPSLPMVRQVESEAAELLGILPPKPEAP